MKNGNKTALKNCRFLNKDCFPLLYDAFIEAFSDYVIQFALTETQFRNHIILNAVDIERTIGCFEGSRLVAFSLNGFGPWEGKSTVYDAGTGVVPDRRRQGLSVAMFQMMLPVFKENGVEQFVLEVVTTNTGAIDLYKKLDFHPVRELALLQCDDTMAAAAGKPKNIDIREITEPDWDLLTSFWDGKPSWQNTVDAVTRSQKMKRMLGAYSEGKCAGYIVFSSKVGRIAQIAVDKNNRNRGIGTALVYAMQAETTKGASMQVINIDKSLTSTIRFFLNLGFYERLSQYEMLKTL